MPLAKQNILGQGYPREVIDFCEQLGFRGELDLAVEALSETFPEAESVTVGLEQDRDSSHQWVNVNAVVKGNVKDVRLRHRDCVRRIINLLPWPQSTLIRTTYTMA